MILMRFRGPQALNDTYEKQGEGSPLWLTNCYKKVSVRKVRGNPSLSSSVHSSKPCRLQLLCLPLACPERSRRIRKHRGVELFFPFWLGLSTAGGSPRETCAKGTRTTTRPPLRTPLTAQFPKSKNCPILRNFS